MSCYVVDIQGFNNLKNEFIMKEISIISIQTGVLFHILVKPSVNFNDLCPLLQSRVNYITKHIHRLCWNGGDLTEEQAIKFLHTFTNQATVVYMKGNEYVAFLKKILANKVPVVDLNIFKMNKEEFKEIVVPCPYQHYNPSLNCAIQKAVAYHRWLLKNLYIDTE